MPISFGLRLNNTKLYECHQLLQALRMTTDQQGVCESQAYSFP